MHSLKEAKQEVKYCELDTSSYSGVTHIQLNSRIWISNVLFSLDPTQDPDLCRIYNLFIGCLLDISLCECT